MKVSESLLFWFMVCVLSLGLAVTIHSIGSHNALGTYVGWSLTGSALGISVLGLYWNRTGKWPAGKGEA